MLKFEKNMHSILIGFIFLIIIFSGLILLFLPQYTPNLIQGLGSFIGNFLGVISGIFITIIVQNMSQNAQKKQLVKNFVLEIDINLEKIKGWLELVKRYRDLVNGDSFHEFSGYFDLSSFLYFATDKLLLSGDLYQILQNNEFRELQEVHRGLNNGWEQLVNNDITTKRDLFITLRQAGDLQIWHTQTKSDVIRHIDLLEYKLNKHLKSLQVIQAEVLKRI